MPSLPRASPRCPILHFSASEFCISRSCNQPSGVGFTAALAIFICLQQQKRSLQALHDLRSRDPAGVFEALSQSAFPIQNPWWAERRPVQKCSAVWFRRVWDGRLVARGLSAHPRRQAISPQARVGNLFRRKSARLVQFSASLRHLIQSSAAIRKTSNSPTSREKNPFLRISAVASTILILQCFLFTFSR